MALCARPKSCHVMLPGCGEMAGNMCGKDKTCSTAGGVTAKCQDVYAMTLCVSRCLWNDTVCVKTFMERHCVRDQSPAT